MFVLEGVDPDMPIAGPALHVGGPAAIEVDRSDPMLGSPANTVVVATAADFAADYLPAGEDVTTAGDMDPRALVRADVVYLEHETGGAVFSVGSIGWCAALSANGYAGAVSRITGNVLDRFLAEPRDG